LARSRSRAKPRLFLNALSGPIQAQASRKKGIFLDFVARQTLNCDKAQAVAQFKRSHGSCDYRPSLRPSLQPSMCQLAGREPDMTILLIDNYDSYSYNLYHALAKAGCEVRRRVAVASTCRWAEPNPTLARRIHLTCRTAAAGLGGEE